MSFRAGGRGIGSASAFVALVVALALPALGGCAPDTGRELVEVELVAAGTETSPFEVADWTVTLSRAEVALGPIYLCATESPDFDRCEAALVEHLDALRIDGLSATSSATERLLATTGTVSSAFFDYGIPWLLTRSEPSPLDATIDGSSAVIEGFATRGADRVDFVLRIEATPTQRGQVTVLGADTNHTIDAEGLDTLTVRVDPAAWLAAIDFDALFLAADSGGLAVPAPGDQAYESVLFRMTSGPLPSFEWSP